MAVERCADPAVSRSQSPTLQHGSRGPGHPGFLQVTEQRRSHGQPGAGLEPTQEDLCRRGFKPHLVRQQQHRRNVDEPTRLLDPPFIPAPYPAFVDGRTR